MGVDEARGWCGSRGKGGEEDIAVLPPCSASERIAPVACPLVPRLHPSVTLDPDWSQFPLEPRNARRSWTWAGALVVLQSRSSSNPVCVGITPVMLQLCSGYEA